MVVSMGRVKGRTLQHSDDRNANKKSLWSAARPMSAPGRSSSPRKPSARTSATLKFGAVFVVALALNFAWEMAQSYLYESMGDVWQATRRCLIAAIGDGAMVLLLVAAVAGRWGGNTTPRPDRRVRDYVVVAVLAVAVELWGLAEGRWAYRPQMPRIPGTRLGVVPIIQMAVLTPLTMWVAARFAREN